MRHTNRQLDDHPDRDELLRAVKTGVVPFAEHLVGCEECRRVFEWLEARRRTDSLRVTPPSESQLRHSTLPLLVSNWEPVHTEFGDRLHDSWTNLPAAVTRDSAMGLERTFRFTSGSIVLELVADRTPDGWHFAARCYRDTIPSGEFVLKAGRRKMQPGLHSCYAWAAPRPPRTLQLLSPSLKLVFDTGLW